MEHGLKQRLVGAAVLVLLGVLLIPVLLDEPVQKSGSLQESNIPPRPGDDFAARIGPPAPLPPDEPLPLMELHSDPIITESETFERPRDPAANPDAEPAAEGAVSGASEPRVGVSAWVIQLGSFEQQRNALDLQTRLREMGYAAFVDSPPGREGQLYRVRIGPELLHAEAQRISEELQEKLDVEPLVRRYP